MGEKINFEPQKQGSFEAMQTAVRGALDRFAKMQGEISFPADYIKRLEDIITPLTEDAQSTILIALERELRDVYKNSIHFQESTGHYNYVPAEFTKLSKGQDVQSTLMGIEELKRRFTRKAA